MENSQLWKLCQDVNQLLMKVYQPGLQDAAHASGLEGNEWAGWLLPAYVINPHPISAQTLRIRSAYTNPAMLTARLNKFANLGFLHPDGHGFQLTDKGMAAARAMFQAVDDVLKDLHPIADEKVARLESLFNEVIQSFLAAPIPEQKWCLEHNRGAQLKDERSTITKIDQLISDVFAWRDDCHLAAWQPYHYIHGFVWEAFTLLWRKDASNVSDICNLLSQKRGFDQDEYQIALGELHIRGWAKETAGRYDITLAGNRVRQAAEEFTEELFNKPINLIGEPVIHELNGLLSDFVEGLTSQSAA